MIEVKNLVKDYGKHHAVKDISFSVPDGQIVGLLGPNGAGKSTTMNIMTGYISATSGEVKIGGYDILEQPIQAKKLIGYLPEIPPLYEDMTVAEYLNFICDLKGIRKKTEKESSINEVTEAVKISDIKGRLIKNLSKGYKQRVGLAQALIGNPPLLILDEPTVGLDPLQIIEIRDLIKKLGETHTVIFSSHILSEVQTICDEILIINKGKLVAFDTPGNLEKQLVAPNAIALTAEALPDEAAHILAGVEHITEVTFQEPEEGRTVIKVQTDWDDIYAVSRSLFLAFARAEKPLLEMSLKKASLEAIFLELTEDTVRAEAPERPQIDFTISDEAAPLEEGVPESEVENQ